MEKLVKKGKLLEYRDGKKILLNPQYQTYPVNDSIINVWTRLDGTKSTSDVAREICAENNYSMEATLPEVQDLVRTFKDINLAALSS